MRESKIAKSYAKSYFDLAVEQDILEPAHRDMNLIAEVCVSNSDFRSFLKNPIIKNKKKQRIIRELFSNQISNITLSFLNIIVANNREEFIERISRDFIQQYRDFKNIKTAYIKTAVKIDKEMREKIKKILEQQTNAQIDLVEQVDEDLIGGFILTLEDKQYDASILFKMKKLIKEFEHNIYIRKF